jgi:hypothetical protein
MGVFLYAYMQFSYHIKQKRVNSLRVNLKITPFYVALEKQNMVILNMFIQKFRIPSPYYPYSGILFAIHQLKQSRYLFSRIS